ncbi:MAG: RNA polymerase sporulation sigma factor SigK [Clostridiales bacterium]|jgi:RNA polymerase sporulation-specific sigma factor|nr:RNA polymerase sporulation sigma factor SigK [Clostridiales bacterium]
MLGSLLQLCREIFFFSAYVSGGNSFPEPLSPYEESACLERYAAGDESARTTLIERNLRLVAHIAKKYTVAGRNSDDLISIGTIGLIKAVSTYNRDKGTALATYAARCIDNEILMSIRSEKRQAPEISLFDTIGTDRDGNDIPLSDILGSDASVVSDEVELLLNAEKLHKLIVNRLNERERLVIELRYGLAGKFCMTQREIANMLDISRSYVSRIEKKALGKLKQAFY